MAHLNFITKIRKYHNFYEICDIFIKLGDFLILLIKFLFTLFDEWCRHVYSLFFVCNLKIEWTYSELHDRVHCVTVEWWRSFAVDSLSERSSPSADCILPWLYRPRNCKWQVDISINVSIQIWCLKKLKKKKKKSLFSTRVLDQSTNVASSNGTIHTHTIMW